MQTGGSSKAEAIQKTEGGIMERVFFK